MSEIDERKCRSGKKFPVEREDRAYITCVENKTAEKQQNERIAAVTSLIHDFATAKTGRPRVRLEELPDLEQQAFCKLWERTKGDLVGVDWETLIEMCRKCVESARDAGRVRIMEKGKRRDIHVVAEEESKIETLLGENETRFELYARKASAELGLRGKDEKIFRIRAEGASQEEIGEAVGLEQSTISDRLQNIRAAWLDESGLAGFLVTIALLVATLIMAAIVGWPIWAIAIGLAGETVLAFRAGSRWLAKRILRIDNEALDAEDFDKLAA